MIEIISRLLTPAQFKCDLPDGADIIHVRANGGDIELIAEAEQGTESSTRYFHILQRGFVIPEGRFVHFLGAVDCPGLTQSYTFLVYEDLGSLETPTE